MFTFLVETTQVREADILVCSRRRYSRWTTCPCGSCIQQLRRVQKHRNAGVLPPARSAEAWERIDLFLQAGWTPTAIATAAGMAPRTVLAAVRRRRATGLPSTWSYGYAELLLGLDVAAQAQGGYVPVAGARRRLRALACLGWSVAEVAACIAELPDQDPVGESTLDAIRSGRTDVGVRPQFDRAVRAVYALLCMRHAPPGRSATRARTHAAKVGWLPPLAYDDEDLDSSHPAVERRARRATRTETAR
ncbi:MAG: hypothetical protein ACT4QF_06910 [Sporichthyaceae bacterium]